MFTQLIASRPARDRSAQGTTFSLAMHGVAITLAVLLTAETQRLADPAPSRVVEIGPFREPRPTPAPPKPAPPVRQPAPVTTTPVAPAPPLPVMSDVPTSIPAPASDPVAAPTSAPGAPTTGEPGQGEPASDPSNGALGASDVDVAAALLPHSPLPRYPDLLRGQRLQGVAVVRFVVGTNGRVEPNSVVIVEASHPAFAESVRAALPRMRFRPARIGAKPVRQLVEFPVGFKLDR